jgi:CheY-like chemotaxis protein/HPt (histidine-containing phosphotransfer) domain-containing protein
VREAAFTAAATAARRPGRILLAEDNPVNQTLALKLLAKQGLEVVLTENGKEALAAWQGGTFDAVLMDVQMPEMGGLEATARIREIEKTRGGHITIIAMTAHAMAGDREKCLAAGMDDYLSKPLRTRELLQTLERVLAPARGEAIFDQAAALDHVDGSPELLAEVAGLFLQQAPVILREIESALSNRDAASLGRAAHRLIGSAQTLAAPRVVRLASALEEMGSRGEIGEAAACVQSLLEELNLLRNALTPVTAQPAA